MVSEYIQDSVDIEAFADGMIAQGASHDQCATYLGRLADAVNSLVRLDVYHNDLAGKNILTRDGETFYFIDLDGVDIHRPYDRECRMRNHVQLYDSLLDRWDDTLLVPFLGQLLPPEESLDEWMREVRARQAKRRARTLAMWKREGKIP